MVDLYDVHNRQFIVPPSAEEMDASLRESFGMTSTPQVTDTANGEDVWSRLAAVQRDLNAPKNQRNSFGNYNYRSCEDILSAVKPLLARERLLLTISDTLEYIGDRHYVKAMATVISLDGAGGMVQVSAYAREASDRKGMDDSQVTGSTSSYARKYALNGLFLIDDTKDADTDEHQRATNQFRQAGNEPDKWGPGTGGGHPDPDQPAQNAPQGGAQAPAGNRQFAPAQPGTGGPATEKQKGKLWGMSGKDESIVAGWAAEYDETPETLTKGTASVLIDKHGGNR